MKAGYKPTEVGVIPEDWNLMTFDEIAKITRGASPRPISDPKWFDVNSLIGWVRISDISNESKYLDSTKQKLSPEGISNSRYVERGNLILSICATVGKPKITKIEVCIHDGFVVFENLKVNKDYVYSYLLWIENDWSKEGQTGSQMNLNTTIVGSTCIPLPPTLEEQRRIAGALSDMDELISSLEKLIEKKKAIKQGAMQELLTGKTRLPGFTQQPGYKPTEVGVIPEDWGVVKIFQIAIIQTGSTPSTADSSNYGKDFLFVSSYDLGKSKYIYKTEKGLSEKGFSISRQFPKDSILFTCIGSTIGKVGIANEILTSNQQINAIFPNDFYNSNYLYYYLDLISPTIRKSASEQAVPLINKTSFGGIKITFPSIEEQQAIARVLSDMDEEIQQLQTKVKKYRKLKQGMMQELLTGKTRLV